MGIQAHFYISVEMRQNPHFTSTNVNGACMQRFGTEKTICDFCHQGNILKSQNLEP